MSYGPALTGFLDLPFPDLKLDEEDLFGASLLADEPADAGAAALQLNSLEDLLGVPDIFVDDVPSTIQPEEAEKAYQFAVKLPTMEARKEYIQLLPTELRKAVLQLIKDKQARNQQKQAQIAQLQANAAAIQSRRRNDLGAISSSALRAPRSAAPPAPAPNTVTLTEIKQIVAEIDDLKKSSSSSLPNDPQLLQAYRQAAVPASTVKAVLTMSDLVAGPPPPVPPPAPLSMPLSLPQTSFLQQLVPAQRPSPQYLNPIWRNTFFQQLPLENFEAWKEEARNRLAERGSKIANYQWVDFLNMTPEAFSAWKEGQSGPDPKPTKLTGQFKNFTLEDFQQWKEKIRAELRRLGFRQPRKAEDRKYFNLSDEEFQKLYDAAQNKSSSKKRKAPASASSSSSSSRPRIN